MQINFEKKVVPNIINMEDKIIPINYKKPKHLLKIECNGIVIEKLFDTEEELFDFQKRTLCEYGKKYEDSDFIEKIRNMN